MHQRFSSQLKTCPELKFARGSNHGADGNPTVSSDTENFHRSERIRVQLVTQDYTVSATALLSELRKSDPATTSAVAIWLVGKRDNHDRPIEPATGMESSLLATIKATILDDPYLRPMKPYDEALGNLTHPENLSPKNSIFVEGIDCSTDGYARAVRILRSFSPHESQQPGQQERADYRNLIGSYRAYDVSSQSTHELISKLIAAKPSASSVLLQLHEVLARVDQSQTFTVANTVMAHLRQNNLESLQGLVAKLIEELWRPHRKAAMRTA